MKRSKGSEGKKRDQVITKEVQCSCAERTGNETSGE